MLCKKKLLQSNHCIDKSKDYPTVKQLNLKAAILLGQGCIAIFKAYKNRINVNLNYA